MHFIVCFLLILLDMGWNNDFRSLRIIEPKVVFFGVAYDVFWLNVEAWKEHNWQSLTLLWLLLHLQSNFTLVCIVTVVFRLEKSYRVDSLLINGGVDANTVGMTWYSLIIFAFVFNQLAMFYITCCVLYYVTLLC